MSHPSHIAFDIQIPLNDKKAMNAFQEAMNAYHDDCNNYIIELSKKLEISEIDASSIWYLRSRSRWSQSLEDRLLKAMRDGHSNIPVGSGEEQEWLTDNGY